MNDTLKHKWEMLNRLYKMQDDIYHNYAAKKGISDTVFWILYALYTSQETYSQNDLCSVWFFPKQTVNSAIMNLRKEGYVVLNQTEGSKNRKTVELTQTGHLYCERIVQPLVDAEKAALDYFSEEEQKSYFQLFEKHIASLKNELENNSNKENI